MIASRRPLFPVLLSSLPISVLLLTLHLMAMPAKAGAQGEGSEPAGYREAIAAAIQEYEAASYVEAREQFRRAHKLSPSARTLRGLGMAEYELHHYPQAVRYLEQALASKVKPLDGSMRSDTQSILKRASGYVGTLSLQLEPENASVLLDNHRVESAPGKPLVLSVGDHVVDVRAPGRLSERRTVTIHGGQLHELRIALVEAEAATARTRDGSALPRERQSATPVYKRWWLWTTVALVAGGAATAAVLLTQRDTRAVPTGNDNTPDGPPLHPFSIEVLR